MSGGIPSFPAHAFTSWRGTSSRMQLTSFFVPNYVQSFVLFCLVSIATPLVYPAGASRSSQIIARADMRGSFSLKPDGPWLADRTEVMTYNKRLKKRKKDWRWLCVIREALVRMEMLRLITSMLCTEGAYDILARRTGKTLAPGNGRDRIPMGL